MICANYLPDMVIKFDPFICGQLLTFYATDITYYAAFCHNLRIIVSLTFCIICYKFTVMSILAVE
jgi:hypothetical protein